MIYRGNDVKRIKKYMMMVKTIKALIQTLDNTDMIIWR